jgi:hypothetical protein
VGTRRRSFTETYGLTSERFNCIMRDTGPLTEAESDRALQVFQEKYPQLKILIKSRKEDLNRQP